MKLAMKTLAAAAALSATTLAGAASGTLHQGESITDYNYTVSDLSGSGTLTFSSSLIGALNAGKVQVSSVAPATTTVVYKTNATTKVVSIASVSAAAPVTALSGDYTPSSVNITRVASAGGALQSAPVANIATTGGSLQITNLNVDLTTKRVYADLIGGNNVGTRSNVYLWDIAQITGPTSFDISQLPPGGGVVSSTNTVSGLKINADAFNLFAQSMGLTANGITSLQTVTDFGSITSTISARVTPVPESSTVLMMGLGLLGVGLAAARRQRAN